MAEIIAPLHVLELRGGGLGLRAMVRKPSRTGVVMPAQSGSEDRPNPVLLFDDPEGAIEELYGDRKGRIEDPRLINILTTEFQERRLILADGIPEWGKADGTVDCVLLSEARAEGVLQTLPRSYSLRPDISLPQVVEKMRPYFFVEHLPGRLVGQRIEYLLTHGNEQGAASIMELRGEAYLLKARLEIWEALLGDATAPDTVLIEEAMQRTLGSAPGSDIVFHLRKPSLPQIQRAALLARPLPARTFRVAL